MDPTFNATDGGFGNSDGADVGVNVTVIQPDGKILIGGGFGSYNNVQKRSLARLNSDGSVDMSFGNPLAGMDVTAGAYAIALLPDGKILVGGLASTSTYAGFLRRVNADGTLDLTFSFIAVADGAVRCIAVQPDGKILVGGEFTTYAGSPRNGFARLNADGSLDAGFNPGLLAGTEGYVVALGANGKILIGGRGSSNGFINRMNADGTIDNTWSSSTLTNDPGGGLAPCVRSIVLQPDGKLVIAGRFDKYGITVRQNVLRLNSNGTLDTGFAANPGADDYVYSVLALPDGKMLIGGMFSTYAGIASMRVARLHPDGALDTGFSTGTGLFDWAVNCLASTPGGNVVAGGAMLAFNQTGQRYLIQVTASGSVDTTFNPQTGANAYVKAILEQPDGKTIIGGYFTSYNGLSYKRIARFNPDGSPDETFAPGSGGNGPVERMVLQPDGKILIIGPFTNFGGISRPRIARLNADGSVDGSFDPGSGANNAIYCMALQADGKIVIGGSFTSYNGTLINRVARLNPDGSLDPSFNPGTGPNSVVWALDLQPDGKIMIAGAFTIYNGIFRIRIARLHTDGSLDSGFTANPGANDAIYACTVLPNGKILIGGVFTSYAGAARNRIARVNSDGTPDTGFSPGTGANAHVNSISVQPDGKVVLGGVFTTMNGTGRNRVARLQPDGSLDTGFNPGTGADNAVYCTALRPDGSVLIGGEFLSYNVTGRNRIARLNGTPRAGIKVMLEGPYSGGTMTDALRTLPSFPVTEPFTAMGYTETGFTSGATIGSSVLATTGNNAIVDWVLVEMRPASTPGTVAASRAVLLQRDGDVVDLDGVSTVGFAGLAAGNYCVAVKPRNHLPVMLSATTPVSYGAAIATVDFTQPTTQVYDNDARKNVSGVMVLAAGDVSFNETVQYTGSGNDRDPILIRVGSTTPNNSVSGYWREDVNMDGVVKYTGSANDRDIILTNVGSTTPNNTRVAALP